MIQVNYKSLLTAGLAGTAVMTILMLIGPMMGMPKMDMGQMLGPMNPIVVMPVWVGWMMHFIIGIVLTWIYAAFFIDILPFDSWKRGLLYSLLPFVIAQLMVMPMMGMGVFSGGNMMMITGSLIGHLLYGGVIGFMYNKS